ncbi:MAG: response regulator [Candidatus Aureabacteria bacterium]|nr:response regulator [Candidatus Auribacterota bacterium]
MSLLNKIWGLFKNKKKSSTFYPKTSTDFLRDVYVTAVDPDVKPAVNQKIVVFEDSETWTAVLKKALEEQGYFVKIFNNAREAVQIVRDEKPDLVIMDVNMPGITGYEATKMLKKRFENRELPVLILTSNTTPKDKMEAMMAGARTFLNKNQPLEDLILAINTYMTNTALKSDISAVINISKHLKS